MSSCATRSPLPAGRRVLAPRTRGSARTLRATVNAGACLPPLLLLPTAAVVTAAVIAVIATIATATVIATIATATIATATVTGRRLRGWLR